MATPESGILSFDAETHRYLLDGQRLPSVTQILQSAGLINYSYLPPDDRERMMARGRAVHTATHFDDEGDLDEATISAEVGGYLEGWRKFRRDAAFIPELIEYRGCNQKLRFAGTLDRTGGSGNHVGPKWLVDLKTGTALPFVALQLAAYASFFGHPGAFRRLSVELHPDGTYRLDEFRCADFARDFGIFQSALAIHLWKVQFGGTK